MLTRRCTNCREVKPASEFHGDNSRKVLKGFSYRCITCTLAYRRQYVRTAHGQFMEATYIAKRRKLIFTLTEESYTELRTKPCHYCSGFLPETGAALDRINHEIGYELGNVVPCCDICNAIKGDIFTSAEMMLFGKVIKHIRKTRDLPCTRFMKRIRKNNAARKHVQLRMVSKQKKGRTIIRATP